MPRRKPSRSKKTRRGLPEMMSKPTAAEHQADEDGEEGLRNVVAAQADEGGEGQHHEGEFFLRAKGQREGGQRRSRQGEEHDGNRATDEGGKRCGHQGLIAPARHGERSAVENCCDGCRCPWYAQRDGGDRAPVHGAVVDGSQEDDGSVGRYQEGQRQEDRHTVDGAQTRHGADEEADNAANDHHREVDRLNCLQQTAHKWFDNCFHVRLPPAFPNLIPA